MRHWTDQNTPPQILDLHYIPHTDSWLLVNRDQEGRVQLVYESTRSDYMQQMIKEQLHLNPRLETQSSVRRQWMPGCVLAKVWARA